MKCVNCKNCIGTENGYYICQLVAGEVEYVEEWCANNDELYCDGYVEDSDDDFTA